MKKVFKKSLSVVLSLAITVMCLSCAFACVTASAETVYPEKMFKITGVAPNNCVLIGSGANSVTNGHTYKIKMLQKGVQVVRIIGTNWQTYKNYYPTVSTEGEYTVYTYTFDLADKGSGTNSLILFYPGAAGTEAYIADISMTDTNTGTVVKSVLTDGTQSWFSGNLGDNYWVTNDATGRVTIMDFDKESVGIVEKTGYPEKMFKIVPTGSNAVEFGMGSPAPVTGHIYRISMLQKGVESLSVIGTNWQTYKRYVPTVAMDGEYTTYTFTFDLNDVSSGLNMGAVISPGDIGKEAYIADVEVKDVTTNTVIKSLLTDGTQNWYYCNKSDSSFLPHIDSSKKINDSRVTVVDFDKVAIGLVPEEPEEPEEPETPTTMFRIRNGVNDGAVAFGSGPLTAGHTYEISMIQSGVDKVCVMSTNWSNYERKNTTVSQRGEYTIYSFTPTYDTYGQVYISAGAAGSVCFVSDIKVTDIITKNVGKTVYDDQSWISAMVTGNPQYFQTAASTSQVALMDYDPVALGDIETEKSANQPEKAIKITAPVYGGGDDNPAAVMTKATVVAGKTYRLEMYKKGILSVQYNDYTNAVWTPHPISGISDDDGFVVYYFVPTQNYIEIRLSIGGSGKTSYVSGIKLYDIEDETKTNLINDPTESGNFNNWGTHMLASNQIGMKDDEYSAPVYDATATNMGTTAILIDFDIKFFRNIGDYNGDGVVNIRDLLRLKKLAAGLTVTVDDKVFVTDGTTLANELVYCIKLLLGSTYADFKAELNSF